MGLFGGSGQTRQERKAMKEHLRELLQLRQEALAGLGKLTVGMADEGRFDHTVLTGKSEEIAKIDGEADLIARGLEEKLTLEQLEDLAREGADRAPDTSS
jgi:hypothetical protein